MGDQFILSKSLTSLEDRQIYGMFRRYLGNKVVESNSFSTPIPKKHRLSAHADYREGSLFGPGLERIQLRQDIISGVSYPSPSCPLSCTGLIVVYIVESP
jgi:hypothetical protein